LSPDKRKVSGDYLRWLIRSYYFNEALNSSSPQTTIKTITMPQLAKLQVALPPLVEQQKICAHLEARLGETKKAANCIEAQIAALTAYRKSLIHECVTGLRRVTDEDVKRAEAQWPSARNLQN
jgi:type I restriction enzyme S subunit